MWERVVWCMFDFTIDTYQLEYIFRLALAGICGMLVGLERKNRSKEAGTRTHFVVACGAALIMVISKYAFFDMIQGQLYPGVEVRLDPSRVASTIASGIGFLGAGMIFVHKNSVSGLTTAAGIWATSGIGMAIGAGLYVLGVSATVLILIAQFLLHLNWGRNADMKVKMLDVDNVTETNYLERIKKEFKQKKIAIQDITVESSDETGVRNYILIIEYPATLNEDEILNLVGYKSTIRSCS